MKKNIYFSLISFIMLAAITLSSCAGKKSVSTNVNAGNKEQVLTRKHDVEVVKKVYGNNLKTRAYTSKIKFVLEMSGKSVSVQGQLEIKQDKYIRIHLVPLGLFEAAMIEFTTDHVLVLDRMNKEYLMADYSQLPFLQENGIDYYSLESLFRNSLFVPGEKGVSTAAFDKFKVSTSGEKTYLSLNKGKLNYRWTSNSHSGIIDEASAQYISGGSRSALVCSYSDFSEFSGRLFPYKMSLHFTTNMTGKQQNMKLTISSKKIKAEEKGDGEISRVPSKYEKKDVRDLLKKILDIK